MHLVICRNPELNNAVCSFQVDHPLLPCTMRKKYQISRVFRTKNGNIGYMPSTNEQLREVIRQGYKELEEMRRH